MSLEEHRRIHLEARAIAELKERVAKDAYMSVMEVAERLGFGRDKVEELPREILPFTDFGTKVRSIRRYHPADVMAVDAVMRAYHRAKDRGELDQWLEERRAMLDARDRAALQLASEVVEGVA